MSIIKAVSDTSLGQFDQTLFSTFLSSGYYNHFEGFEEFFVEDFANILSNKYSPVEGVVDDRDNDSITAYNEADEHPYTLTELFDAFAEDEGDDPVDYHDLDEIFDPGQHYSSGTVAMHLDNDDFLAGSHNDGKNRNELNSVRYLEHNRDYLFSFDFKIDFLDLANLSSSWLSLMQIHQNREDTSFTDPLAWIKVSAGGEVSVVVAGNDGESYASIRSNNTAYEEKFTAVHNVEYSVDIALRLGESPSDTDFIVQISETASEDVVLEWSLSDSMIGYYSHSSDELLPGALFKIGPYRDVPTNNEAITVQYSDIDVFAKAHNSNTEHHIVGDGNDNVITYENHKADQFRESERIDAYGGNDTVEGGYGDDLIYGGAGSDFLYGGVGSDGVVGGDGVDYLYGGAGDDLLQGEGGVDYLYGGDGNDALDGGSENDLLRGNAGDDTILGGTGTDTLRGGEGADSLEGQSGSDSIYGEEGADKISGGAGNDYLNGGAGADIFVFSEFFDYDIIGGFEDDIDAVALSDFYSTRSAFDSGVLAGDVVITEPGTSVQLDFQNGDILRIYNMTWAELSDDLVF